MNGRPHLAVVPDLTTEVRLTLPVESDWLALARTTGAAVAARGDFTYDEIADLRLAIDELCLSLIERNLAAGRIELCYTLRGPLLRVEATLEDDGLPRRAAVTEMDQEFSERILDALVDDHGDADNGRVGAWFAKRRSRA